MTGEGRENVGVAAVQFEPVPGDKERNLRVLTDLLGEAAANGARLVVTPEMGVTGYCWADRGEIAPHVEPVPGPTTRALESLAARTGACFVVGLAEREPASDVFYNTVVLVGPEGLLGKYRKVQPFTAEPRWAKNGDLGFPVFRTPVGSVGLLICMDAMYPEPARVLALQGADVICLAVNWFGEEAPSPFWRTRAWENGVYLIVSNRWGEERGTRFAGGSCVIDHEGRVQSRAEGEDGIVYSTVDIEAARGARQRRLACRRPRAYHSMLLDSHLWNPVEFFGLYGDLTLPEGRPFRAACVQAAASEGRDAVLDRVRAAGEDPEVELVVAPPLSLPRTEEEAREASSTVPGWMTDIIGHIARRTDASIVTELVEEDGSLLFKTVVLVDPDGRVEKHRKAHLSNDEKEWASPGEGNWTLADADYGRLGLLSGDDLVVPENARCLAVAGADVLCCPSALVGPSAGEGLPDWHLGRVRAGENNTFLLFANLCGNDRSGPAAEPSGPTRSSPPGARQSWRKTARASSRWTCTWRGAI